MSPRQEPNKTAPTKRDHRQEVTDSIVKMLEEGVAPWQKPWESAGMPLNPTTDKAYRGGNAVHLMVTGISRGYEDPRWMTYKQADENGWQVRKGEKRTHIEFWEVKGNADEKNGGPGNEGSDQPTNENQRRLIHRVYTVFNAKQIDGVPAFERTQPSAFEAVHSGERILANSGAKITHDQRDSAFYRPSTDSIHLPPKEAFKDAPGYYDTANHAAYVGSWIKALKEDKNEIFRAAHDAFAATDFVLSLEHEVSRAEALEVGDSVATDVDRTQVIRDEIGVLENDRDLVGSGDHDLSTGR
jgi:antirestriction protein ArdC